MTKTITEIKSLSRTYSGSALRTIASIMRNTKAPPSARVAAATALLDRGWGKPTQSLAGDKENPLRLELTQIVRTIVDPGTDGSRTASERRESAGEARASLPPHEAVSRN